MDAGEFWWRRVAVWWAFAVAFTYTFTLFDWLLPNPLVIKSAIPFFGAPTAPRMLLFAGSVLKLAAGFLVFAGACLGAGDLIARFLRLENRWTGSSIALGCAGLGILIMGAGLAGLWYGWVFIAILAPAALAGMVRMVRAGAPRFDGGYVGLWRRLDLTLPAGLAAWVILLTCLAPETFQDPLRYHFFVPGRFLLEHKFVFVEHFFYWSYMSPVQMFYGAGIALVGESWAAALNVLFAVLALAALVRIGRAAGLDRNAVSLALALTITAPGFALVTGATFVEQALSLSVLLALESVLIPGRSRFRRAFETALFLGVAGSVKYTAFFGAAGLAVWLMIGESEDSRRAWLKMAHHRAVSLLAVLVAPLAPWCLNRWLFTGDPVSPILGRAGLATMDTSSLPTLKAAYAFAHESWVRWISNPGSLLSYPFDFTGAHEGFWEHPGPAIVCLLPAGVLAFRNLPAVARGLVFFSIGSAGAWIVFFGGVSPHYVSGFFGIWTLTLVLALAFFPGGKSLFLSNLLRFIVFFQALICVVAMTMRFAPRDVAFGIVSPEYYLEYGLAPERTHYPARQDLEREFPDRGTVYVFGDDQSYYLGGRIHLDYENGSDPYILHLAGTCHDADELRKRLRQRSWTHMLYSSRWPDLLGAEEKLVFRHSSRTLELMQEFWGRYARPVVVREAESREGLGGTFVFALAEKPLRAGRPSGFSKRLPFLPGAEPLLWEGDQLLAAGDYSAAEQFYRKTREKFPGFTILDERLARVKREAGR